MLKQPRFPTVTPPTFEAQTITEKLRSGYWVEVADVDTDGRPDLVCFGMSMDEIYWYENSDNGMHWTCHPMVKGINMPVGMDSMDLTGNGSPDFVVCYDLYGASGTFKEPASEGGRIDWLENPGLSGTPETLWKRHYVGQSPATHRVRVGHFTRRDKIQILGFPIVSQSGMHSLLDITLYTQPDDITSDEPWSSEVVCNNKFRFIHGVEKYSGFCPESGLDANLICSDEGISIFYFNESRKSWIIEKIGHGEQDQFEKTGFRGSGDAAIGAEDGNVAYVAAIEPFHGNCVAVYVLDKETGTWKRHFLDIYSEPNELGESPGHSVVCADFDGDGVDEFLIGLRGPDPWQGVVYYKPLDLQAGLFAKWKISNESVARIAVGQFSNSGRPDFVTIGYSIKNYFEAANPKVIVYHNQISGPSMQQSGSAMAE
ncbi:VCBS repeat-containing protein [uncultured Celeribacter sp.]|uniref:FG-GAP repeat domain-containing protein n=1 Tax=uncultured Celeribacter sp. TaxID=1303376 RepID=UPI002AA74231|nr:VCBS repeat-containing protein [uncultured Celeribacter sp.]